MNTKLIKGMAALFLFALPVAGVGCAAQSDSTSPVAEEEVGTAEQAVTYPVTFFNTDPACVGEHITREAHNAGWQGHVVGTCAANDAADEAAAGVAVLAVCGTTTNVKYAGFVCQDHPIDVNPSPPPATTATRTWTVYYACCSTPASTP